MVCASTLKLFIGRSGDERWMCYGVLYFRGIGRRCRVLSRDESLNPEVVRWCGFEEVGVVR
jgi:hypothetical protein